MTQHLEIKMSGRTERALPAIRILREPEEAATKIIAEFGNRFALELADALVVQVEAMR